MAVSTNFVSVLTFLSFLVVFVSAEGRVPIIAWSNGNLLSHLATVPAGHTVSPNDLQQNYLDAIVNNGPQNIVLLLQDKLSMEDFTLYGDVYSKDHSKNTFHNLKKSLDSSASSLTLPTVDIGHDNDLVRYLKSHINGGIQDLQMPASMEDMKLDGTKTNVIIHHLTAPESEGRTKAEKLANMDKYLGEVSKSFQSESTPYTMLLTASQPSYTIHAESFKTLQRVRREGTEETVDNNSTYTFMNTSCVYLFASKVIFVLNTTGDNPIHADIDLTGLTGNVKADCADENRTLTAVYNYNDGPVTLNLTMKMVFDYDRSMWLTNSFQLVEYSYKNNTESYRGKNEDLECNYMSAPLGRSYHCDNPPDAEGKSLNGSAYIDFTKLQIQPYNITDGGFSAADDCIGFFTEAIWMSLISILLMILIFAFGLIFLLSLSTMDRFDDPKGKQLVITTDD
ncbi:V-type proton ATPase subunit S1-like [Glandiceps talaboti]